MMFFGKQALLRRKLALITASLFASTFGTVSACQHCGCGDGGMPCASQCNSCCTSGCNSCCTTYCDPCDRPADNCVVRALSKLNSEVNKQLDSALGFNKRKSNCDTCCDAGCDAVTHDMLAPMQAPQPHHGQPVLPSVPPETYTPPTQPYSESVQPYADPAPMQPQPMADQPGTGVDEAPAPLPQVEDQNTEGGIFDSLPPDPFQDDEVRYQPRTRQQMQASVLRTWTPTTQKRKPATPHRHVAKSTQQRPQTHSSRAHSMSVKRASGRQSMKSSLARQASQRRHHTTTHQRVVRRQPSSHTHRHTAANPQPLRDTRQVTHHQNQHHQRVQQVQLSKAPAPSQSATAPVHRQKTMSAYQQRMARQGAYLLKH